MDPADEDPELLDIGGRRLSTGQLVAELYPELRQIAGGSWGSAPRA